MNVHDDRVCQEIKEWILHAEADLAMAKHGLDLPMIETYPLIGFHVQQCAEKSLKAYLIYLNMRVPIITCMFVCLAFVANLMSGEEKAEYQQPEYQVTVSSVLDKRYKGENVIDNDLQTAWAEGVPGPGIGEWVQIQFNHAQDMVYVGIIPGYTKYRENMPFMDLFYANNRIHFATLYLNDDTERRVELYDFPVMQYFLLPNKSLKTFKLRIDTVYPGSLWNDSCISEIRFLGRDTKSKKVPSIGKKKNPEQLTTYTFMIPEEFLDVSKLSTIDLYWASAGGNYQYWRAWDQYWGAGASVGENNQFLKWLKTKGIITQIGKQDQYNMKFLVYQMDLRKAYQHRKEIYTQFRMVGDDVATNILYGLERVAIKFKDTEIIRFFIYCPGDAAGATNKLNILWEIREEIPAVFYQVLSEQPEEVWQDITQNLEERP